MTCTVDGCYAKAFSKNLCRNHFYMWKAAIPKTAQPGSTERGLRATPAAFRKQNDMPYIGPCRCAVPTPQSLGMFGGYQCAQCGMPLPTGRIRS